MRERGDGLLIENLCVYCNSNKSFSYLQKCAYNEKKDERALKNEYEQLVYKKTIKYKWVKNLSYNECLLHVLKYVQENNNLHCMKKKYCEQNHYKSSSVTYNIHNKSTHVHNKTFVKNKKYVIHASRLYAKNKRSFKPKTVVDKALRVKEELVKEKLVREKLVREKLVREKLVREKLVREKLVREKLVKEKLVKEKLVRENLLKNNMRKNNINSCGKYVQDKAKKNFKLKKSAEKEQQKKGGKKKADMYIYLFNLFVRRKYYKRISRLWLANFLKRNGLLYKNLAMQLINILIIKTWIIFDVQFWNFFFSKNLINYFNTNLYFLVGKPGNEKKNFLMDIFLSFPFKYSSDTTHIIDLTQYEQCSIVSDYRFVINPTSFLKKVENALKNSSVISSPNIKKINRIKNINKPYFAFKIFDSLKIKGDHMLRAKSSTCKICTCKIHDYNLCARKNCACKVCYYKNGPFDIMNPPPRVLNGQNKNVKTRCLHKCCAIPNKTAPNNRNSMLDENAKIHDEKRSSNLKDNSKQGYHDNKEQRNDSNEMNSEKGGFTSFLSDSESCSSFDLYNYKENQYNKNYFLKNGQDDAYKKKGYVNKILYPYYYEIALKECVITDIERNTIRKIDPFNKNLEYLLISFTKIALVKQLVWKRKIFRLLYYFFKKKMGQNVDRISGRWVGQKILGLNLFNGGYSFVLIKNFDQINMFSVLKKNCIIFLLLKYIYMWKELNLNVHMFITGSFSNATPCNILCSSSFNNSIDTTSSSSSSNCCTISNTYNNVISFFSCYLKTFFVFVVPTLLHNEDRYKLLTHLFLKNKLNYSKDQLENVSKITNSYNKANLMKLFEDEYRERIIHLMKKKKIHARLRKNKFIKELVFQNKYKKYHFFSKTLNFQNESHLFIHNEDFELFKKKSFEEFRKNILNKTYGFNDIIGEDELVRTLKREVVQAFFCNDRKGSGNSNNNSRSRDCSGGNTPFNSVGILIHGTSGSGKTFISKKIIEECNCNSIIINCSNIFNKIMGESEKLVNEIFHYAKNKLQPCIILMDGIENICFKEDTFSNVMEKFAKRLKFCFYENIDRIHFERKWDMSHNIIKPFSVLIIATTTDIKNVDHNLLTNYRITHIYKTKEFISWNDKDIYTLFERCLRSNNIKSTHFIYSKKFQHFVSEHILKKKDRFSPLFISNLCRDSLTSYVQRNISKGYSQKI
ncbi:AAA family ATPase, putative [Plasmodium malariae]|uniref:AAA family ATPase, putative n=1 Tax=Plasmodium malariae TaxID=5858 RepID=A0A1C3KLC5_PLAMA|nr:AAA family ATPase, putative [Plasmodium malariae]